MAAYFKPTRPEYELVADDESEPSTPQPSRSRRTHVAMASVLLCAAGAAFAVVAPSAPLTSLDEEGAAAGLTLGVTNEYGALASVKFYPWAHLAEAHKESTLSASFSSCTTCHADAMTFHWTISHAATDGSGDVVEDYATSGVGMQTLAYTFTQAATMYTVSTRAVSQGGERVLKLHQDVMCKYVRREIRQLTTADRERYLSAVRVFHTVDATKGRKAYGPKFTNYAESVQKHLQRMTLDGCTPFHGYDTFLTAHEAFVLEFEQALQAVDPKIAAPYWDYTIDSTLYGHSADIGEKSIIFSDDWFGPVDNSATGDVLTSKYFSNLPVPKDASAPEHNGFGYVTDSVNQSPSPYVTRATSVCGLPTKANLAGCTELRSVFKATSLSALRTQIETVYHASLHMALGGVTDCAYSLEKAAADEMMGRSDASKGEGSSSTSTGSSSSSSRTALFEGLGLMANTIWRTLELGELMRCDTNCDSSATSATTTSKLSASCTCSCPSVDAWSDSEKADLAYDQLDHLGLTQMLLSESATSRFFTTDDLEAAAAAAAAAPSSSSSSTTAESSSALSSAPASPPSSSSSSSSSKVRLAGATEAENAHFWKWFVDFACHPGAMASYATPLAANNDPIFWVSHASWGRFWHFVQLAPSFTASGDFHADWADPTVSSFMDGFTNVSNCENMLKETDTLPFKGFTVSADDLGSATEYTNADLLELFTASNPELPYVYSDFDWSHCGSDLAF